jgi:hypothetical protein
MSAIASKSRRFLPLDVHRKLEKIAAENNVTVAAATRLCLVLGLEIKAKKGLLIKPGRDHERD